MNDDISPSLREQYSQYARQLLSDLGMADLEQPLRGQLLASTENYVGQVVTNVLLENLETETLEKIADLTEDGKSQDETIAYLVASTPGIQEKIQQAVETSYQDLRNQISELTSELGKNIAHTINETTTGSLEVPETALRTTHDDQDKKVVAPSAPFPWEVGADEKDENTAASVNEEEKQPVAIKPSSTAPFPWEIDDTARVDQEAPDQPEAASTKSEDDALFPWEIDDQGKH